MVNHLCCVQLQHLFGTVQTETTENKTVAKNRRNKTKKIVTGYELTKWVWLLAKTGIFRHNFQTSSAANPPFYSMGVGGSDSTCIRRC